MFNGITDGSDGVLISDGRSSIRLTQDGQPHELGYPTIIDVLRDSLLDYGSFRTQLVGLHTSLRGVAGLGSYEGFELNVTGNGSGAIEARVEIIGEHVPLIQLKFEIYIDQSYLPAIIRQIDIEFPRLAVRRLNASNLPTLLHTPPELVRLRQSMRKPAGIGAVAAPVR